MVKVDLKIYKNPVKGRVYYYAWRGRGAPRLKGEPGSPEFMRSYNEAIENRRAPDKSRFRWLVADYKANDAFKDLEVSTKRNWARWLDCISDYFGELRIAQFDRLEKIRPEIRKWRQGSPINRAPPTTACRCYRACWLMVSNSASSP